MARLGLRRQKKEPPKVPVGIGRLGRIAQLLGGSQGGWLDPSGRRNAANWPGTGQLWQPGGNRSRDFRVRQFRPLVVHRFRLTR